jgi:hypothetical protein
MAVREIRCPSCGATPTGGAAADGAYMCGYCGARYSITAGAWAPPPAQSSNAALLIAIGLPLLLVVLVVAGGAFFLWSSGEIVTDPGNVEVLPTTPAEAKNRHRVSTPAPAPEPTAEPLTAEFVFHGTQKSLNTTFYVLGEVTNTSKVTIDKPEIMVVLLDDAGKEVGLHNGFAAYDNLAPDESSPVEVLVMDPPPHAKLRFETNLRKSTYIVPHLDGLVLEADPPQREQFRGIVHTGKVHNRSGTPAKFVQVFCLARDNVGKLLDVDMTFVKAETLAPGDSARFQTIGLRLEQEPAKFDLVVIGQPAT